MKDFLRKRIDLYDDTLYVITNDIEDLYINSHTPIANIQIDASISNVYIISGDTINIDLREEVDAIEIKCELTHFKLENDSSKNNDMEVFINQCHDIKTFEFGKSIRNLFINSKFYKIEKLIIDICNTIVLTDCNIEYMYGWSIRKIKAYNESRISYCILGRIGKLEKNINIGCFYALYNEKPHYIDGVLYGDNILFFKNNIMYNIITHEPNHIGSEYDDFKQILLTYGV